MKRLLGCILLLAASLAAQSLESTLIALKNPQVRRKALSNHLVEEMLAQAKPNQSPARTSVQRFCEDLTTALLGKDVTAIRAAALARAISDVLSGKGSTFLPAGRFYDTLSAFRIEDRTVQALVDRFREIGEEIRGPDDLPITPKFK